MSAAKMVADSTQSEFVDGIDGKKRKKKLKKTGKKVLLPEDEDSDLDLKKDLKPISAYVKDRPLMIEEMFRSVRGASLQRALPDLLKSIALNELKLLCMEQLEVMSKKRIRRILAGEESANISSSGTEDDTSDEETQQPGGLSQQVAVAGEAQLEGHPADSTSVHQDNTRNLPNVNTQPFALVKVKEEPPDFGDDGEAENEEDAGEEAPETYTSGSEDGELVKKEQGDEFQNPAVKQEPMSESEEPGDEDVEDEDEEMEGDEDAEEVVLPSIMMDQMELLELEMRARAIKAMLSSHDGGAHVDDEDEHEDDYEDDDDVNDESAEVDDVNIPDDESSAAYT